MATKKTSKKSPSKRTGKGAHAGNHVTANSVTAVARIAKGLYAATLSHADARETSFARQINRWLALGAKADGLTLTPETKAFAGL